jgi:hypothetical protein
MERMKFKTYRYKRMLHAFHLKKVNLNLKLFVIFNVMKYFDSIQNTKSLLCTLIAKMQIKQN